MVVIIPKKKRDKKDNGNANGSDNRRKPVKYVYPASKHLIFLVIGEPKESQYSYGVPIVPLHGKFRAKDGKVYDVDELRDYYVVLNVDKDDGLVDEVRNGARLVVLGYKESEVFIADIEDDGEEE